MERETKTDTQYDDIQKQMEVALLILARELTRKLPSYVVAAAFVRLAAYLFCVDSGQDGQEAEDDFTQGARDGYRAVRAAVNADLANAPGGQS